MVAGGSNGGGFIQYAENIGIGKGSSATVTVNVTGVNDAPVAANDAKSTDEGTVLNAAVPAATDADGTVTGYVLDSDVASGELSFNSDGTYSFDPNGEFEALGNGDSEQVTFTYRAIDNDGAQSAAKTVTITIKGVNEAPVASDGTASTDENTVVTGTVDSSDVDGTVISHALVTGVAKGSLTFLEDGSWSFDRTAISTARCRRERAGDVHLPRHRQQWRAVGCEDGHHHRHRSR